MSFRGPNRPVTMGAFLRTSRMCVIVDMIPSLSSACDLGGKHGNQNEIRCVSIFVSPACDCGESE